MKINSFEEVIAWQKAKLLTKEIYSSMDHCRDFAFRDQLQRASVSVMNNIAEGFERQSSKELKYFLYVAKGSCGEVRSMLILAHELDYINSEQYKLLSELVTETSRLLSGFIKTL